MTTKTAGLYETATALLDAYPLAVSASDGGRARTAVLQKPGTEEFFCLIDWTDPGGKSGGPAAHIRRWRQGSPVALAPGMDAAAMPDWAQDAIVNGVPLPDDGSLFGWVEDGYVTTLITVKAEYDPQYPLPTWTAWPHAALEQASWPPFTSEDLFGGWFWDFYAAGLIQPLHTLIHSAPGQVWWAPDPDAGAVIAAADDVSKDGITLPAGVYMCSDYLLEGRPVPQVTAALASPGRVDLAPRFQRKASR